MRGATLTGRMRYRQNWRGKIIVQVEEEGVATFRSYSGDPGYVDTVVRWRDAQAGDLFAQSMTRPWLSGAVQR